MEEGHRENARQANPVIVHPRRRTSEADRIGQARAHRQAAAASAMRFGLATMRRTGRSVCSGGRIA
jgi:hypothetical protein